MDGTSVSTSAPASLERSQETTSNRSGQPRSTQLLRAGASIVGGWGLGEQSTTFLPRDAMLSAVYAVIVYLSVRLSVCVCLSHFGIV